MYIYNMEHKKQHNLKETDEEESNISTSTTSDTFETWTLVTEKDGQLKSKAERTNSNDERVDILKVIDKTVAVKNNKIGVDLHDDLKLTTEAEDITRWQAKQQQQPDQEQEEQLQHYPDDLSDDISIISDCESSDRISPQPFLTHHLNDLNLSFNPGDEFISPMTLPIRIPSQFLSTETDGEAVIQQTTANTSDELEPHLRHRRRKRTLSRNNETRTELEHTESTDIAEYCYFKKFIRHGIITRMFYAGVLLAILAFIGRMRYSEWQYAGNSKPITAMEQKINDLELQNNLMRAEIDIISKQVNYLSSLSNLKDMREKNHNQENEHPPLTTQRKSEKTFKVWPGNGNSMEPMHVTKEELKRPFQCPNGKFVEVAAMCIENVSNKLPLPNEINDALNNFVEQSEGYRDFEKLAKQLNSNFDEKSNAATTVDKQSNGGIFNNHHKRNNNKAKRQKGKQNLHKKQYDQSKEHHNNQKDSSKEQREQSKKNSSKEGIRRDNSREKFKNNKYYEERNNKFNRKGSRSNVDEYATDKLSGEWHNKLMQHREETRRQQEHQINDNNWYINRGNSRERMRYI